MNRGGGRGDGGEGTPGERPSPATVQLQGVKPALSPAGPCWPFIFPCEGPQNHTLPQGRPRGSRVIPTQSSLLGHRDLPKPALNLCL